MFVFNNIQAIWLKIDRTAKKNKYMWTNKKPKNCSIYIRLGNHKNITTKGNFGSNIGNISRRRPNAMHSMVVTSLIFTLQIHKKREGIATLQQLEWPWFLLKKFWSQLIQLVVSPSRDVLGGIDIRHWITRNFSWLNKIRGVD